MLRAVAAKEGESVYAQYADYREPVLRAAGHRILAINRGEREEWLKVAVECDDEQALQIICRAVIEPGSACSRRGARGGEGRVGQAHQPVVGARNPKRADGQGERGRDPRLRRQPAASF